MSLTEYSSLTRLNYEFDSKHRSDENAFTGNPVYLSVETTSMATYNIMYFVNFEAMRSIFTGNGNGSFKVNIAEVLETLLSIFPVNGQFRDVDKPFRQTV